MQDTLLCPICNNKLRNFNLAHLDGYYRLVERTCTLGNNHSLRILAEAKSLGERKSDTVRSLKVSLNPQYSLFVEVDYINGISYIICSKDNKPYRIKIDQILEVDLPNLVSITEKCQTYLLFS